MSRSINGIGFHSSGFGVNEGSMLTSSLMKYLLVPIVVSALLCSGCGGPRGMEQPQSAAAPSVSNKSLVLDVRTPQEFASGHVAGAINLPVDQVEKRISELVPSKDTPLIVYCRSGRRSAAAKKILDGLGYTRVEDFGSYESARQRLAK
jgi:phage shock protein E